MVFRLIVFKLNMQTVLYANFHFNGLTKIRNWNQRFRIINQIIFIH